MAAITGTGVHPHIHFTPAEEHAESTQSKVLNVAKKALDIIAKAIGIVLLTIAAFTVVHLAFAHPPAGVILSIGVFGYLLYRSLENI